MQQNYALMFLVWLGRLIQSNNAEVNKDNPLVLNLDSRASGFFLLGRDNQNQPFLGIPIEFMPFFVQIDWMEISFCREEGRLYLEARDPSTQALHMALGLSVRSARLNVICLDGKEQPEDLVFSMRVFKQNPQKPEQIMLSDQVEITGIPIKEIQSVMDLGTEMEIEDALRLYDKTGMGGGFTTLTL